MTILYPCHNLAAKLTLNYIFQSHFFELCVKLSLFSGARAFVVYKEDRQAMVVL